MGVDRNTSILSAMNAMRIQRLSEMPHSEKMLSMMMSSSKQPPKYDSLLAAAAASRDSALASKV